MRTAIVLASMFGAIAPLSAAQETWETWPPRAYLLQSLVQAVPDYLASFDPASGQFGSEPWICNDQNVLFPLAVAWVIEDKDNPWYHDESLLEVIAKGGEALVDAMDADGKWTFRKKDHSTWGQIHMPWTYSRWIRAYQLVGPSLPEASRATWEKGLLLGFTGIRTYMDGRIHNIPTHHAMGLYIAGECFANQEWKDAATAYMARVVEEQDPAGFWSENFGPVVGYNEVYVDALGIYYHFSQDPVVLEALRRSAGFHSNVLWPDGSPVACIDERQIYHPGADTGNVGFSWTPEGRGFLLSQVRRRSQDGQKPIDADYAAAMLLYGGQGAGIAPAASGDTGSVAIGNNEALVRRQKPWAWALSAYACPPADSRWIQDRHNLMDVFHDELGLVIGGGNTKLQPYWSTFTAGDPALLTHTPGDENPDFTPEIPLRWTPDSATIQDGEQESTLALMYRDDLCKVTVRMQDNGACALTYSAPAGSGIEAHIPLLRRVEAFVAASGATNALGEEPQVWTSEDVGGGFVFGGLRVTLPPEALVRWPARQHNPYAKDGKAPLVNAKLVICLPFISAGEYTVTFEQAPN